jgi:hypothetical protein
MIKWYQVKVANKIIFKKGIMAAVIVPISYRKYHTTRKQVISWADHENLIV